jgi:N-dimethylarginine dimethylaminohydrolase
VAVLLLVMDIAEVGLFVVPGVVVGETTRADMEVVEQVKNDTEAHMNVIYHHVIMAGRYHMHCACTFLI